MVWYGGGKLAADLTLPKLRGRWVVGSPGAAPAGLPVLPAKGALRALVARAAAQAVDEPGFFAGLRAGGVLVRLRFSEISPGQVTGYSVSLPGHCSAGGEQLWHGGGRLADALSLPRLRRQWDSRTERSARPARRSLGFTGPERNAAIGYAARLATDTAGHIHRAASGDMALAADSAHATADFLHIAARITGNHALRQAAAAFDRAARSPYGRIPAPTRQGAQLRSAARLLALAGPATSGGASTVTMLASNLAALVIAVAELRHAQQHAAQATAARLAVRRLKTIRDHSGYAPRSGSISAAIDGPGHQANSPLPIEVARPIAPANGVQRPPRDLVQPRCADTGPAEGAAAVTGAGRAPFARRTAVRRGRSP